MVERLTILKVTQDEDISLQTNQQDVWTTAIKVISNFVPFGSPIGELITSFIPNQKIERVIKFNEKLNEKLIDYNSKLKDDEKRITILELKSNEFADLYEDAANQASRALTDERLEYVASLLANSLTDEELEHIETKKLMSILNELTDTEIIWLQYYALYGEEQNKFYEEHEKVLEVFQARSSAKEYDKQSIQSSYKQDLVRIGLLKEHYKKAKKDEFPEIDYNTGKSKVSHYETSNLGNALLRIINLEPSDKEAYE
jgi:hypothetical protein